MRVVDISQRKGVILNSRQGLRPIGSDAWIQNSRLAVQDAVSNGYRLLTSVGMNSWEMVLSLASKSGAYQKVFVPLLEGEKPEHLKRYYMEQFRLNEGLIAWSFVEVADGPHKNRVFQQARDRQMMDETEVIYPVSIREGGNLEALLREARTRGKEIRTEFATEYSENLHRCKTEVDPKKLDCSVDARLADHVIHWTKASNGPWPGEGLHDFYEAVCDSSCRYPRSGLDTLIRILAEGRVRACSRHYRKGAAAVAFSSLRPSEAARLMKWRARYREMTFEPYGIAIRGSYAEAIGIKKVFYGNPEMYDYLGPGERPYFQSIGTKGYWIPEKEYRHIGDVDLTMIPRDDMRAVVWKKDEVEQVEGMFSGPTTSLYT